MKKTTKNIVLFLYGRVDPTISQRDYFPICIFKGEILGFDEAEGETAIKDGTFPNIEYQRSI